MRSRCGSKNSIVTRFSLSKLISPLALEIVPLASVRFPIVEPVAALIVDEKAPVPVTLRAPEASVPSAKIFISKEIAPLLSVMLPLARVIFPVLEPLAALIVEEKAPVPVTERAPEASVPVVTRFSSPRKYFHLNL